MELLRKFLRFLYYVFTGRWPELKDFFRHPKIDRHDLNPILSPSLHSWESQGAFNPAAALIDGRVHLLYRAIGSDGLSRIGYASSEDGLNFDERLPYPVFQMMNPKQQCLPGRICRYDPVIYPSGGSWGGCEDPRMVNIEDRVYVTFNAFDGWDYIRIGSISLSKSNFLNKRWYWTYPLLLSPEGEINKNWVLFPEKINGQFAILHSITPELQIDYIDSLEDLAYGKKQIKSNFSQKKDNKEWDAYVRGVGPPPVKTDHGWLVIYHAVEKDDPGRYKVGVMLLDLNDPTKILAKAKAPVLAPDMHYENDWKPGVVYVCGAVIKDSTLMIYYGGGDKYTCVATSPLNEFMHDLKHKDRPHFYFRKALFG